MEKFDLNVKFLHFIENNCPKTCISQIKCLTLHQENKILIHLKNYNYGKENLRQVNCHLSKEL